MQKHDERIVLFMDVKLSTMARRVQGLPVIGAGDLAQKIISLHSRGKVIRKNKSCTESYYLADVKLTRDKSRLCLLVNKSDRRTSDPAFSDPDASTRRVVNKQEGEGQDYSTHIVWSLSPQAHSADTYLFLMEASPGMPSPQIAVFLNYMLKEVATLFPDDYFVNHPDGAIDVDGQTKKIKTHTKVELRGHLCDDFLEELRTGRVNSLELFTESDYQQPWDSHGYATEKKRSVSLKVVKGVPALGVLRDLFNKQKKSGYEQARISFKTEEDVDRSVKVFTDTFQVANDFKYVKKRKIDGFQDRLISSYDALHVPILRKMTALIP